MYAKAIREVFLRRFVAPLLLVLSLAVALVSVVGGASCSSATQHARLQARTATEGVALAVSIATDVCADVAIAKASEGWNVASSSQARALLASCRLARARALGALAVARASLEAWSEGGEGRYRCALSRAVDAAAELRKLVKDEGARLPSWADAALDAAEREAARVEGSSCLPIDASDEVASAGDAPGGP